MTPYRWRESRCHSGKQFNLIDARGKAVAFVQPSFPDWVANIGGRIVPGTKQACIDVVEKAFGMTNGEKDCKQGELF